MKIEEMKLYFRTNNFFKLPKFYKIVLSNGIKHCDQCLRTAGEIVMENDPILSQIPHHPNCKCGFVEVPQAAYLKQQQFKFEKMNHLNWYEQTEEEKYLWCNSFRKYFGCAIDKYAKKYNIPKQLLAGIIANEMLDWNFPDGTILDGISGGGIGYAQIALKTARQHGINGSDSSIKKLLTSYDGCVAIAAKILKEYIEEFQESIKNKKIGHGFQNSDLYSSADPYILERENLVCLKIPLWLLQSMCAIWNSGIAVIYAKDPIGDKNYRNARNHGLNSCILLDFLPKLVNE